MVSVVAAQAAEGLATISDDDSDASDQSESSSSGDSGADAFQIGAFAFCGLTAAGQVRAARVFVVEATRWQTVVACPASCALTGSGTWSNEEIPKRSYLCACQGGLVCPVIFYSVAPQALQRLVLQGAMDFRTSSGQRAVPLQRSVLAAFYDKAQAKSERIATETTWDDRVHLIPFAEHWSPFVENSVILIPDFFTIQECMMLISAAERTIAAGWAPARQEQAGLDRLPVSELGVDIEQFSTSVLLNRVLPFFEKHLSEVFDNLFSACRDMDIQKCTFTFSPGEPAVNRYTVGGEFKVHKDLLSVTLNVLQ